MVDNYGMVSDMDDADFIALEERVAELERVARLRGWTLTGSELVVPTEKAPARRRGTRIDENFTPALTSVQRIRDEFPWMTRHQFEAELVKFVDYWMAKAGKDAVKLDWERTWCNWMRSAAERMPRLHMTGQSKVDAKAASYLDD